MKGYKIYDWVEMKYRYIKEEDYKESQFTEIVNEAKMNRDGVWNDSSKPAQGSVFDLQVGQEVWFIASWSNQLLSSNIKTVGTKYITIDSHNVKFHKHNLSEAGTIYGAPLRLILDIDKYKESCKINKAKARMRRVNWGMVDVDDFFIVQKILSKYPENIYD